MFTHPGKKLLFMGGEFGQWREWNHDAGLDWQLLDDPRHAGLQAWVRDLNHLYAATPALWRDDVSYEGFSWIDCNDHEHSVISFIRRGDADDPLVAAIVNFTPVPRHGYRVGLPTAGAWREVLNSDAASYGGSNVGNGGLVRTEPVAAHGHAQSVSLSVPPLGFLLLSSA
jgi:1,4-alpha-glucan branching enzyme